MWMWFFCLLLFGFKPYSTCLLLNCTSSDEAIYYSFNYCFAWCSLGQSLQPRLLQLPMKKVCLREKPFKVQQIISEQAFLGWFHSQLRKLVMQSLRNIHLVALACRWAFSEAPQTPTIIWDLRQRLEIPRAKISHLWSSKIAVSRRNLREWRVNKV